MIDDEALSGYCGQLIGGALGTVYETDGEDALRAEFERLTSGQPPESNPNPVIAAMYGALQAMPDEVVRRVVGRFSELGPEVFIGVVSATDLHQQVDSMRKDLLRRVDNQAHN